MALWLALISTGRVTKAKTTCRARMPIATHINTTLPRRNPPMKARELMVDSTMSQRPIQVRRRMNG